MKSPRRALGVLSISMGVVLFATGGGHARAQTSDQPAAPFQMSARADTVGEDINASGFPAVPGGEVGFATLSSAQATLDAVTSQAFASAPYPGDFVTSLPPTINGIGGGRLPPVPAYPFYVSSANPTTPTSSQQLGPYEITAASGDTFSKADSLIGLSTFSPQVVSASSHASLTLDRGTGLLVSQATSDIAPFALNGLISIGEIRSTARLSYDPSSPAAGVKKQTSLSIGALTIAGIEVGLTEKGFVVAGQPLAPVDISALQRILAPTGISLQYVPGSQSPTSVTSAALQITYHNANLPAPFLNTTLSYVLGRVSATVSPGAGLPGFGATTSTETAAGQSVSSATSEARGNVTAPAAISGTAPGGSIPPSSPSVATAPATRRLRPRRVAAPLADLSNFYLVFILAGVLALGTSQLQQWMTLRLRLNRPGGP